MPTNDDTTTSDRPEESAVGAAAAAGASDAVARAVATAKTSQLNPAQVVHRLHTAAHEYTIEALTGDDEDRAYTGAVADELRSAAASVSADDHTAGVWDGDTFRHQRHRHPDAAAPACIGHRCTSEHGSVHSRTSVSCRIPHPTTRLADITEPTEGTHHGDHHR